jgi:DNA-binding NtrC family response regulator
MGISAANTRLKRIFICHFAVALAAKRVCPPISQNEKFNGRDILMPGMNGIELAQLLSQERPKTKVLLISGNTEQPIPRHFRFLAKPFTVEALHQTMAHLLPPTG